MKKKATGFYMIMILISVIAAVVFAYLWSVGQGVAAQAFGCASILAAGAASFTAASYLTAIERSVH